MASPAAADLPNGISTPPTTNSTAGPNPSPPTSSQQLTQSQPQSQPSQLPNGLLSQSSNSTAANGTAATQQPPSYPRTSLSDTGTTKRPRDARLLHLVLANMGVHAYSERVPLQLLDFAYRYTSSVLSDALSYGEPAPAPSGKKGANSGEESGVSLAALRTAVSAKAGYQFQPALPKEFLAEVAAERNRVALPRVEREYGVRLPPERYCLTGVGWGVKDEWESEEEEAEEMVGVQVDAVMGGMGAGTQEEEMDEDEEFEEVMGVGGREVDMVDG
ncbi:TFIID-31kDa-domain-containing protein [Lophium mytilinum]|uniref:TFIID-31kDa-domain-containing protein n=1 Tax=Lophium mytilinum TaxID=390894 RepID=A0A6A6QP82_9PEZI|nr:TFIID-31kDa-domain-containing protein [Lophium mytilinum]